jgi:hypothetical protein
LYRERTCVSSSGHLKTNKMKQMYLKNNLFG